MVFGEAGIQWAAGLVAWVVGFAVWRRVVMLVEMELSECCSSSGSR